MEAPVQELIGDFLREASVGGADTDVDLCLQRLIDDGGSSSAVLKRDMRRLLERDAHGFLRSACRILKVCSERPGVASMLDLLWSSPVLLSSLIDPTMLFRVPRGHIQPQKTLPRNTVPTTTRIAR